MYYYDAYSTVVYLSLCGNNSLTFSICPLVYLCNYYVLVISIDNC